MDLQRLYFEYFDTQQETEPVLENGSASIPIPFGMSNDGSPTDLGLEIEAHMNTDDISAALGFQSGRPFLFNPYKHSRGFSTWTNPGPFEDHDNPDLQPLSLHPHQLSGLHSIIRTSFSSSPASEGSAGKLIADEVGLGKTAIVIATIAFLSHMTTLQLGEKSLPPILSGLICFATVKFCSLTSMLEADRNYLGCVQPKDLRDTPHLIAVPGTLLAQWESELRLWFLPKKVDIIIYSGKMQHDDLWGSDGLVTISKHKRSNIIILATHSVIPSYFPSYQSPIHLPFLLRRSRGILT